MTIEFTSLPVNKAYAPVEYIVKNGKDTLAILGSGSN